MPDTPIVTKEDPSQAAREQSLGDGDPSQVTPPSKPRMDVGMAVKLPLVIIATICVLGALDYAQSLVLPIVLAFVISLTLSPVNIWLQRRLPSGLAAFILVGALSGILFMGAVSLSQPVGEWIDDAPEIGRRLSERLHEFREPVDAVNRASQEVEELANATSDQDVEQVVVRNPGLLSQAADNLGSAASTIVVAIALTYFLLVTNRLLYEKIVHAAPKLSDKKRALSVVNNIVNVVSKYLLTITIINACFGATIGVVMFALGMPDPILWGLAGFLLNYLPFVGSLLGTVSTGLVALLTFDNPEWALAPPIAYFAITTLEGHFITPSVLGHRLELNPVVILISIALWGFLWGVSGVILAVPILIITKVVCDNIPSLAPFGEFLSGATHVERIQEEPVT